MDGLFKSSVVESDSLTSNVAFPFAESAPMISLLRSAA